MKLVQKILSHGLLIAFLVAGFFVYMNRVEIFPQWFGEKSAAANETAAEVKPVTPATSPTATDHVSQEPGGSAQTAPVQSAAKPAVQPQSADIAAGSAAVTTTQDAAGQAAPEMPSQPQQETAVTAQTASQPESDQAQPQFRPLAATESVDEVPAGQVAGDSSAAVAGQQAAETSAAADAVSAVPVQAPADSTTLPAEVAEVPAEVVDKPAASTEKPAEAAAGQTASLTPAGLVGTTDAAALEGQLERARSQFWKRDMAAAETAYVALGEQYPANADVWGEIGNFYFSLRKREAAVDAYSRSLLLLTEQGDNATAQRVLGVLYQLDADKAIELEQRLRLSSQ